MILDKIVEDKKARLIEHKNVISLTEMKKLSDETEKKSDRSFYDNLKKEAKYSEDKTAYMRDKVKWHKEISKSNQRMKADKKKYGGYYL